MLADANGTSNPEQEQQAGGFAVDLVAEDGSGNAVIVENQLERGDHEWNKSMFDRLYKYRPEVEQAFGGELEWQRLEGKRACRIRKVIEDGGLGERSRWPHIQSSTL
jgi:hypothetical protein